MHEPFSPSFFSRLQHLRIRTRRAFLGQRQGSHLSLRRGHGLEFSDYRPYTSGDDFRHIDWRVAARTDRIYVRQFREEKDVNVSVLLDASRSMAFPEKRGKFELAKNLGLVLGYIGLSDGDPVTYTLLGQKTTPHFVSPRALGHMIRELDAAEPIETFSFPDEVRKGVAIQRVPGKCFVISDFLFAIDEIVAGIDILRAKNFDITLLQVLTPDELALTLAGDERVLDAESGEEVELSLDTSSSKDYDKQLHAHLLELEQYCRRSSISYALLSTAEPLSEIVFTKFPALGILT